LKSTEVVDPKSVFHKGDRLIWVAIFSRAAATRVLREQVDRLDVNGRLYHTTHWIKIIDPSSRDLYYDPVPGVKVNDGIGPPGDYSIRIYAGKALLAQGFFHIALS
jgi:hypothetical protein